MPKGIYKRETFELPEELKQIKHAVLKGASNYIIFEDKRVWSKSRNKFKKPTLMNGNPGLTLVLDNGKTRTTTIEQLYRENLIIMPQIEGVEHKPMNGYQNLYQIYSNGMIWSKRENHALSVCHTKQGYDLVCLQDQNVKLKTGYIYRLVYQNFVGPIPENYQIHHINGNHRDNSIENLQLVTKSVHRKYHYSLNKGVKIKERKYITVNKI